jgi:hypothetical protein
LELEILRRGPRVFISYAFSNRDIKAFEASLRDRGCRPNVVEATTLLGRPSLSDAIRQLIQESDYVVPLVDEAAANSIWVQKEIQIAIELNVPIIPMLEPGVVPAGILQDIPCIVEGGFHDVVNRVLQDYTLLDFDPSYPAHILSERLEEYMRHGQQTLVDASLDLSHGMAAVVEALVGIGHPEITKQAYSFWYALQRDFAELERIVPVYREMLKILLDRYSEPEKESVNSWNAFTRLLIGRDLIEFALMFPHGLNTAWGMLRNGAAQMLAEWEAIREEDFTRHLWLWGIGNREFGLADWSKDHNSPLGEWLLATATLYDGTQRDIIVPDEPVIASGLRLGESPRLYLESWHWIDFILPQIANLGKTLRPDLGKNMLVELHQT